MELKAVAEKAKNNQSHSTKWTEKSNGMNFKMTYQSYENSGVFNESLTISDEDMQYFTHDAYDIEMGYDKDKMMALGTILDFGDKGLYMWYNDRNVLVKGVKTDRDIRLGSIGEAVGADNPVGEEIKKLINEVRLLDTKMTIQVNSGRSTSGTGKKMDAKLQKIADLIGVDEIESPF